MFLTQSKSLISKKRIWLSLTHIGRNELKYVHVAFESNLIALLGPNVDFFEKTIVDNLYLVRQTIIKNYQTK